ncbi:hypothetical protein D3C85_1504710 [compost metagenome]
MIDYTLSQHAGQQQTGRFLGNQIALTKSTKQTQEAALLQPGEWTASNQRAPDLCGCCPSALRDYRQALLYQRRQMQALNARRLEPPLHQQPDHGNALHQALAESIGQ